MYRNSPRNSVPIVFADQQMLEATWREYKRTYIEQGSMRTFDPDRGGITTSEGQSYTMLRAVWLDDKPTFDASWKWTVETLQRPKDHLFAWKWGKTSSTTYGVLVAEGGQNSASDADTDIALALVMAYARWQDRAYLDAAHAIITDIWEKEVIVVDGTPYMTADNLEKTVPNPLAVINPSYLHPAAYRIFAKVDPAHPWQALVNSSYALIDRSIDAPLGSGVGALPPDWIAINKKDGSIVPLQSSESTNFSFDAMRVPYRLALDYYWYKDPRASTLLQKMSALSREWTDTGKLVYSYSHDGVALAKSEVPALYGAIMGYFMVADPTHAADVYQHKLFALYDPGRDAWKVRLSYYDDNWAWFGISLYNHQLPNIAGQLRDSAFSEK
jgi:endoglucanase